MVQINYWLLTDRQLFLKFQSLYLNLYIRLTLSYLSEEIFIHKPNRSLKSYNIGLLPVTTCRTRFHRGDWAFVVVDPSLWNNLPISVRTDSSLPSFKYLLSYCFFYFLSFSYNGVSSYDPIKQSNLKKKENKNLKHYLFNLYICSIVFICPITWQAVYFLFVYWLFACLYYAWECFTCIIQDSICFGHWELWSFNVT